MSNQLRRLIESAVAPIRRRVMMSVARAVIRVVNDEGGRQVLQVEVQKGEVRDGVERVQEYGFTSVPFPGAGAAVMFVAGNREQGLVVAVDDRRYRLTGLAAGEVALYDDQGQKVHLTRTGVVVETTLDLTATVGGDLGATVTGAATLTAASVAITAATVTITGDVSVTGGIAATGTITGTTDVVGGGKSLKTHTHGGVAPGGSNTSAPN